MTSVSLCQWKSQVRMDLMKRFVALRRNGHDAGLAASSTG